LVGMVGMVTNETLRSVGRQTLCQVSLCADQRTSSGSTRPMRCQILGGKLGKSRVQTMVYICNPSRWVPQHRTSHAQLPRFAMRRQAWRSRIPAHSGARRYGGTAAGGPRQSPGLCARAAPTPSSTSRRAYRARSFEFVGSRPRTNAGLATCRRPSTKRLAPDAPADRRHVLNGKASSSRVGKLR
jgi:hypothetical protein